MKWALRKRLLDGRGEEWDELLPYVAMGYRISKQKAQSQMRSSMLLMELMTTLFRSGPDLNRNFSADLRLRPKYLSCSFWISLTLNQRQLTR